MEPEVEGQETTAEPVVEPEVNNDPPYKQQLEEFPESLRPIAEKQFQEWDKQVNDRFDKLHSQYEPWKDVFEATDPETVNNALLLAQAMQERPQEVWEAIAAAHGFSSGQGQNSNQQEPNSSQKPDEGSPVELDPNDPLFQKLTQLEQNQAIIAQALASRNDAEALTAANQQLDQLLTGLREKHGDFNEKFVLGLIANGADPEKAVEEFKSIVSDSLSKQNSPNAPTVVGGGGGVAAEPVDVTKMSPKDTKTHVADLLAKAAAEANG